MARRIQLLTVILTATAFVGCTTATYGVKPTPVHSEIDTYTFKIFTGGLAGGTTADKKAVKEFDRFRNEGGFTSYTIVEKEYEVFPSGFRYKVRFVR